MRNTTFLRWIIINQLRRVSLATWPPQHTVLAWLTDLQGAWQGEQQGTVALPRGAHALLLPQAEAPGTTSASTEEPLERPMQCASTDQLILACK